ncbi:MAG TPA: serine O-acetyltransferase [Patescibacteria group bacterium]|nr:serine O-acetyltransferase [Patescibacteria group bacterium]
MTRAAARENPTDLWPTLKREAEKLAAADIALAPLLQTVILPAPTLSFALGRLLSEKLASKHMPEGLALQLYSEFAGAAPDLEFIATRDLQAIAGFDPAARDFVAPFLFFKGFHALQSHRLAHYLWNVDRQHLALFVQNRVSDLFGVDIHPAARIGSGVMMDHATGIVIGETAIVEDDVLFWHGVTLGGRSLVPGDRHPKVRQGAILGAHATIIGNIEIGAGAKVAAGSVVVHDVPPGVTVAGTPAKAIS